MTIRAHIVAILVLIIYGTLIVSAILYATGETADTVTDRAEQTDHQQPRN
jgi:galactitol-specific phosphotransferase system IIC component